ncbi:MAG: tellurite resistance TerB family protein [Neisseriaceae bacterium]|nr:tellurite resistance TerB family protein [Neisseriaceae bacterium]MBP6862109.1 tellurite resistance TerB family protein [Neisseriaceae bacterium]
MNTKGLFDQVLAAARNMTQKPNNDTGTPNTGLDPLLQGLLGGIGGGMLGSWLSGKRTNSLAKIGGSAALAALAYRAYQNYSANKGQVAQPGTGTPEAYLAPTASPVPTTEEASKRSMALLLAVINAAKADGVIAAAEREAIFNQAKQHTSDPFALAWVEQILNQPVNLPELTALATTPQLATEIYVASLAACASEGTNAQEQAYLNQLQQALNIDDGLKQSIETALKTA